MVTLSTEVQWEECWETYFSGGVRADEFSERYTVISKKTGKALVNGNYVDATVNSGMADASILARSVGATLVKSGNTATFKIGDGAVKFTEGSADYEVNGETKTFSAVCMKNGLISIKAISEIFARPLYETDNSYTLYFDNLFNKQYADQIANLV